MFTRYSKVTAEEAKDTGLAVILLCLLLGNVFFHNHVYNIAAIIITILVMTKPTVFKLPAIIWFGLSHILGSITSTILLSIVFFCIVWPIGFFINLFRKDPMQLHQFKQSHESVFFNCNKTYQPQDLVTPF